MTGIASRNASTSRRLCAPLLCAALLLPGVFDAARAADAGLLYSDHTWKFAIQLPPGWTLATTPRPGQPATVRARFRGPQASQNGQSCNITVMDAPAIASLSQAEINRYYDGGIMAAQPITEIHATDPGASVVDHRIVLLNGRSAQITDIKGKIPIEGMIGEVELYTLVFSVPGRTYIGNCTAMMGSYDELRPGFDAMMHTLTVPEE